MILPNATVEKSMIVKITHPDFFDKLCHFMVNKPRNHRTLQDLTAKAHREAGNNMVYGGGTPIKISPADLAKHVAVAWCDGAQLEDDLFAVSMGQTATLSSVNRNLTGKSLVMNPQNALKQALRFGLMAKSVSGSGDQVRSVLECFDELL